MELHDWLTTEVALVEARLQGQAPVCQLDRLGASPPSLKEAEGRYFVLRRAARLLELGQPLQALAAEADKARAFLAVKDGPARNRAWAAYFKGVLDAVEELGRQRGGEVLRPTPRTAA